VKIGAPKETKDNENRVGLTPAGVATLCAAGHEVVVEHGAGVGCGFSDSDYAGSGAMLGRADDAWQQQLVVKVKEPLPGEYPETFAERYPDLKGIVKILPTRPSNTLV